MTGFIEATRGWESPAEGLPTIRGRRTDGATAGGKTTIHFLPGNGFCGGVYWSFLKHLLPAHELFLSDFEGHGESDPPKKFSGNAELPRRAAQVIREQGLDDSRPLVGMGHSSGAARTVMLAAANPGLFKALVLLDPIMLPTPVWAVWRTTSALGLNSMARTTRKRRSAWPSRDGAFSHLRGRGIFKGWPDEALADFVDHAMKPQDGQHVLRCPLDLEADIYEHPIYVWGAMRKVRVPVLFLYGDRSYGFFPWSARTARRANPQTTVATAPGGHCFMLERPAQAFEIVDHFLKGRVA